MWTRGGPVGRAAPDAYAARVGRRALEIGEWGEINVFQRYSSWYARARYRHEDGVVRPHEVAGKTPKAAKSNLKRQFEEWADKESSALGSRSKVPEAMAEHLTWVADEVAAGRMSPGTLRTYESVWRNHLEPAVRGWTLADVTPQRIDRLLKAIAADQSQNIALTCRALLSSALKVARRYGAITTNPMHDTRPVAVPRPKQHVYLTQDDAVTLMRRLLADDEAHRLDIPDLVLWMLLTSERIGNALAAEWPRIDLEAGVARLGKIVVWVKETGLVVRDEDSSSKAKGRTIALPAVAVEMLARRRAHRPSWARFVFPHTKADAPRDPSNTSRAIKAAVTRAGFPWVTPHVFRKTVATALGDTDVQTRAVSDYLGHAKEGQTFGTYIGRRVGDLEVRDRLDDFYGPVAEVVRERRRELEP